MKFGPLPLWLHRWYSAAGIVKVPTSGPSTLCSLKRRMDALIGVWSFSHASVGRGEKCSELAMVMDAFFTSAPLLLITRRETFTTSFSPCSTALMSVKSPPKFPPFFANTRVASTASKEITEATAMPAYFEVPLPSCIDIAPCRSLISELAMNHRSKHTHPQHRRGTT